MLGKQLRKARLDRKLSLRELAKKAGLSPQFIWDIETGRRNPSLTNLQRIADALGIEFRFAPMSANGVQSVHSKPTGTDGPTPV